MSDCSSVDKETRKAIYSVFGNDEAFTRMCFAIAVWREEKGFFTPSRLDDTTSINEKLMLIVSEVAEACEAVRHQNMLNFREEIADTFIRLMDLVGTMEINIADDIYKKMLINEDRPHMHGKVC